MNYLDRLKEKFPDMPPDSTAKTAKSLGEVENMPPNSTAKTAKSLFTVFAVGQVGTFSEKTDPQPEVMPAEPSSPCPTCGSNHFWLSPTGWQCWGCTDPPQNATTLCIPASRPTPDSAGNIPYRLNVGNVTRLVWLPPGLEPGEVLARAKVIYPDLEVTDSPPPQGWPRLADVPEIPKGGTPQPVEAWTPSGQRLVVTAYSDEHAAAIRRMNPPPATAPPANCRTCQRYAVLAVRCGFYGRTVAKPTDPICNGHQFKPREEVQS